MNFRTLQVNDAPKYLHLLKQLDKETSFMLFEKDERKTTVIEMEQQLSKILQQPNSTIIVAEVESLLVGFITAIGGNVTRNKHNAYIVIGILQDYCEKGIGTKLFQHLEEWAKVNGIHRLELTVMEHNKRAIHLYKKMGFQQEGIRKHSLKVNNEYINELYMGKLI